jgi:alginate O-acetyltransferase complex protein AlgI
VLFNSYVFAVFFIVVYLVYRLLGHRGQNHFLLVASYVFYGAWDWRFLSLIFISTAIDYVAGQRIERAATSAQRKAYLAVSMTTNLLFLGVCKYFNFFVTQLAELSDLLGIGIEIPTLRIILPVGISFYTFQSMSYAIDVYRGEAKVSRYFPDFALFVSFFPQLVAGPIERYTDLMNQIERPRVITDRHYVEGAYHILIGLFKKVVIADNMAGIANAVFATETSQLTGPECLLGLVAFAFQIYGDFSGYSSMAQGIANWLGFDLMYNFRMPYFASSPSDFWSRLHISLSTWLRDYLYIPLGGNRHGPIRTYRNLMLTMVLGGLWHGAAWTFIAWGFFHGLILCVYRRFLPSRPAAEIPRNASLLAIAWMFCLTLIGWLFFRAESMAQVREMLILMATDWRWSDLAGYFAATIAFFVAPLMVFEYILFRRGDDMLWLLRQPRWLRAGVYIYFAMMLLFFSPDEIHEFIYFQF